MLGFDNLGYVTLLITMRQFRVCNYVDYIEIISELSQEFRVLRVTQMGKGLTNPWIKLSNLSQIFRMLELERLRSIWYEIELFSEP